MPTPLSIDGRLLAGIELRQMPVSELALVASKAGIRFCSKTKLNEAFRDVAPLQDETAKKLWELWIEIVELCKSVEPLALDLSDGEKVWTWLQSRRRGDAYVYVDRIGDEQ